MSYDDKGIVLSSTIMSSSRFTELLLLKLAAALFALAVWISVRARETIFINHANQVLREREVALKRDSLPGSIGTISPKPQPSILLSDEEESKVAKMRGSYGGKNDKLHLGGFTAHDMDGISNNTFNFMLGPLGIKSVLDIGCGKGISTSYFKRNGARVLGIDGSHDAIANNLLEAHELVEHDFSRGPWWPSQTFDALWSVEFLEHVGRQYMKNYIPAFRRAALVFVSASVHGGWHHAEVHSEWWWISRFEMFGFTYSEVLTDIIRGNAKYKYDEGLNLKRMMVFVNRNLASQPQFAHLIGGHGCVWGYMHMQECDKKYKWFNSDVDIPPVQYQSLLNCEILVSHKHKKNSLSMRGRAIGLWNCTKNEAAINHNWKEMKNLS